MGQRLKSYHQNEEFQTSVDKSMRGMLGAGKTFFPFYLQSHTIPHVVTFPLTACLMYENVLECLVYKILYMAINVITISETCYN